MCEFKILLKTLEGKSIAAKDIIRIIRRGKSLLLVDVLGSNTLVNDSIVDRVDVSNEEVELLSHPLIGSFLEVIEASLQYKRGEKTKEELEKIWSEFKSEGDKLIDGL